MVEALQRMGCRHVLHNYWLGHTSGPVNPSGAILGHLGGGRVGEWADRELQYETAWRLGHWDLPTPHLGIKSLCESGNGGGQEGEANKGGLGTSNGGLGRPAGALGFHASIFG